MDLQKEFKVSVEQVQPSQILPSIDGSLECLSKEVQSLFTILDQLSANIKKVEISLKEQRANFPYRFKISEKILKQENFKCSEKSWIDFKECSIDYSLEHSVEVIRSYLGWEEDELSKQYRLLLINEREIVIGCSSFICNHEKYGKVVAWENLLKKPFIETDIITRLEFAKYLVNFIDAFKKYLQCYRLDIQNGNYSFEETSNFSRIAKAIADKKCKRTMNEARVEEFADKDSFDDSILF